MFGFSRKVPSLPRRVRTPSAAGAAMAPLSTFGSQKSSSLTNCWSASSVMFFSFLPGEERFSSTGRCMMGVALAPAIGAMHERLRET